MLPQIEDFMVFPGQTLKDVLEVINKNAQGVAFLVTRDHKLCGVLTDGDVRRALLRGVNLTALVESVANRNYVSRNVGTPTEEITELLGKDKRIRHIPLIDKVGKLVDYSCLHRLHRIPVMEPYMMGNELSYVTECIQSRWISSQGKYVTQFERMFADICGGGYPVAVGNGTVALHLAMVALGIGEGDEVIVPDLTFAASINTIIQTGATPVIVDVDPQSWCVDPDAVERAITPKTRAIMPVHLYGCPSDMKRLGEIARQHHLLLIEDAAEAFGTLYHGKHVGLFGEAGCFSFFGNKMITTGEGGMILFKDPRIAERARMLRDHGMSKEKRYWHLEVGYNYRMTNLQAAIGVAQLEQFEQILKNKLKLADEYSAALSDCPGVTLPPNPANCRNTHWLYTILIDESVFNSRDSLIQRLVANGIESRPTFYPLHIMPPYQKYVAPDGAFPISERISKLGISLPSSATLTQDEIERICEGLRRLGSLRQISEISGAK